MAASAALSVGRQFALQLVDREQRLQGVTQMLMTLLLVILVLALLGGAMGHSRFGYAGWSPAGIVVIILLVWLLFGNRV
jgi:multidrug transporter EmrE-like cation transporter